MALPNLALGWLSQELRVCATEIAAPALHEVGEQEWMGKETPSVIHTWPSQSDKWPLKVPQTPQIACVGAIPDDGACDSRAGGSL